MIEIQCTSCHTRYRIDERVLPEDTPTFKCSRCGHVFNAEPRQGKPAPARPAPARVVAPRAEALRAAGEAAVIRPRRSPSDLERNPPTQPPEPPPVPESVGSLPRVADEEQANPPSRSVADPEEAAAERSIAGDGENLTFDFSESPRDHTEAETSSQVEPDTSIDERDRWEVGDTARGFSGDLGDRAGPSELTDPNQPPPDRDTAGFSNEPSLHVDSINVAPPQAPLPKTDFDTGALTSRPHSSGFFAGMLFMTTLAFGVMTVAIIGSPAISAGIISKLPLLREHFPEPNPPGRQVALLNLRGQYHDLKDAAGGPALIVTGEAHNLSHLPLHIIQIVATLISDDGKVLAHGSVYCGNSISSRVVSEMTAREIGFFQGLEPPAAFALAPDASWSFVLVFPSFPPRSGHFRIAVVKAAPQPPAADTTKQ
jgi:predicted Zn finger-like uncharacterized protein